MTYLSKRIKFKIFLSVILVIGLYFISQTFRTENNHTSLVNDYKYLASLPADFVYQCQLVEKTSEIPWELYAAYYQVNIDEKMISNFPKEETLVSLSTLFQSQNNVNSLKKILSIKLNDKDLINRIYDRYKILRKHSYLYSNSYSFPIFNNKIYFIDTWGEDRDNGKRAHLGTDLFAPKGTPIYAITSGTIEKIGWDRLGGNRIGIRGKDGLYYYYAHLIDFDPNIKKGDKISLGKLLGYVGNTGNAINTPYHLHFGIEINNNQWINPYNFLSYWKAIKKHEEKVLN